ncbi:MAG TPA: TonB-dependent receptor [Phenylobacterium sp.]|nr:TonB-dependent receptor [Phenylobacterium sp.]
MFSRGAWLLSTVALGCLMAAPALAQVANAETKPDKGTQVQEIVVTGTSIRGEQPVGSDLVSINAQDIKAIGAPNTADLLAKVPQLNSFNTEPLPGLSASVGTATSPALRGLGATATLVLMDGQRLVAENPLQTTPDPSAIPPAAIQRVEIVADGASAIYGSDAVAGVINIITRHNLDGAETNIRGGFAQHGYQAQDFSQAFGKTWTGGSAMIVASYNHNNNLPLYKVPFYTNDLRPFGGADLRAINCAPGNVVIGGVTYAPPSYAPGAAARCDFGNLGDAVPDFRRYSVLANARQQITDDFSVFGDAKYTSTYATNVTGPSGANVTIDNTNPFFFLPPGATGTSETVLYNTAPLTGSPVIHAFSKSYNVIVGGDYSLPRDWNLTGTFNYGKGTNAAHQPTFDATALANAAAGTTAATALDPFGRSTSPAVAAAVSNFENFFSSDQSISDAELKADGPLLNLPGGQMKLAVGLDYRHYTYDAVNSVGAIGEDQNAAVVSATRSVSAEFGELLIPVVGEGNALPLVRSLNVSLAVRHDKYSDFGSTTNPKYGITWKPIDDLTLRASYGKSFHAPDMGDEHAVDTRAIFLANTGLVPPGTAPANVLALAGGNPGLQPEKATTYSVGGEYAPSWFRGFHASLTYWNIKYTGQIQVAPISPVIYTNPAFTQFVVTAPTQAQLDNIANTFRLVGITAPINVPIAFIIDLRRHNLGATNTDGVDFAADYNWDTDYGHFAAGLTGSHTFTFDLSGSPGAPFAAQTNIIKTRVRGELSWTRGPASLDAAVNYSGHYQQGFTTTAGTAAVQTVKPFVTTDLHAAYDFSGHPWLEGTTVSVNIDNMFDEKPPLLLAGGGYSGLANPLGRMVWVGLNKKW